MKRVITIKVDDLKKFNSVVKGITKKAVTNKLTPPVFNVLEETHRTVTVTIKNQLDFDNEFVVPVVDVEVSGTMPVANGYKFVAIIERTDSGNFIRGGEGFDLSAYYNSDMFCEHCNTKRNRKKVVVIQTPEKTLMQVGRSCVKDFLNDNFELQLRSIENAVTAIENLEFSDNEEFGGSVRELGIPLVGFLSITSAIIRKHGWVSGTTARENGGTATKDLVLNQIYNKPTNPVRETEEDLIVAKETVEFFKNIDADSDYIHNLKVIANEGYVTFKNSGFAASMIATFQNQTKKAEEKKSLNNSEFVGEVGKRIEADVEVLSTKNIESYYGTSTLITFVTPEGNLLVTFSSGEIANVEKGNKLVIKGTVKEHKTFKNTKQTQLTRVKWVD